MSDAPPPKKTPWREVTILFEGYKLRRPSLCSQFTFHILTGSILGTTKLSHLSFFFKQWPHFIPEWREATLNISPAHVSQIESYAQELTDEVFLETEEEDGVDAFPIAAFTTQIILETFSHNKLNKR